MSFNIRAFVCTTMKMMRFVCLPGTITIKSNAMRNHSNKKLKNYKQLKL